MKTLLLLMLALVLGVPGGGACAGELAIHVQGNHFVDEKGAVVQLRGVNVSGLESVAAQGWSAADPWGGWKASWAALQAWHVNALRLPLNESSWLDYACVDEQGKMRDPDPGKNYRDAVRKTVSEAVERGIYVILDLHWTAPGSSCALGQNAMADADHSVAFWASVADEFKGNPAVLFELFNEPFLAIETFGWDTWRNGGGQTLITTPVAKSYMWRSVGMQKLLDTVRTTGATNVVIVGGMRYSNDLTGWPTNHPVDPQKQLAAAWHVYSDVLYKDTESGSSTQAMLAAVTAEVPLVISEVGDTTGTGATGKFVAAIVNFADRNGYSYFAWTWNHWGKGSNELTLDDAGTPTMGFGTYYKQHLTCRAEKAHCK